MSEERIAYSGEPVRSYKDLIVWQRSMELVREVYCVTSLFPSIERYGLVTQMRRAAVSIPSNIAEGWKRRSLGDYLRFLGIADGSAAELETQSIVARDLYRNIQFKQVEALLEEVQKMLTVMIQKLNDKR